MFWEVYSYATTLMVEFYTHVDIIIEQIIAGTGGKI